jgi:hypothetical protein
VTVRQTISTGRENMTNEPLKNAKWPLWASIIAVVLAVFSLCAGWLVPYASLLCPVIAIVLAALSLKYQRKTLAIVALVLSILSFCILGSLGVFIWTAPGASELNKSLAGLSNSILHLFQSIITLVITKVQNFLGIH